MIDIFVKDDVFESQKECFLHYSKISPNPGGHGDSLLPSAERPPHPDQNPVTQVKQL